MFETSSSKETSELYALALQRDFRVCIYNGCMVHGIRYHTKSQDERRSTQNHGIRVEAEYDGEFCNFYGVIDEIWELYYLFWKKVVLFKCT